MQCPVLSSFIRSIHFRQDTVLGCTAFTVDLSIVSLLFCSNFGLQEADNNIGNGENGGDAQVQMPNAIGKKYKFSRNGLFIWKPNCYPLNNPFLF